MSAEVISLLSSPDVLPSRPPAATTNATAKRPTSALHTKPSRFASRQDFNLDSDLDFDSFDLTADFPHNGPPKGPQRPNLGSGHVKPPASRAEESAISRANKPFVADSSWFLSDDDFSLSRLTGAGGPSSKRQRLSPEIDDHRNPRTATKPPGRINSFPPENNNRRPSALSPCASARSSRPAPTRQPTSIQPSSSSHTNAIPRENGRSLSSVSPSHVSARPTKPRPTYLTLDDEMFASSSPRNKENKSAPPVRSHVVIDDDTDPFISSSLVRPEPPTQPAPRKAAAWDPISSSAPLPALENNEPRVPATSLRRNYSEIITLDDSDDSLADPSEDEDFPNLATVDGAELRAKAYAFKTFEPSSKKQGRRSKPQLRIGSTNDRPRAPATKKSAEEKEKKREEKAAAREAEKERKRIEKERAKENRALEREKAAALAAVNKIRTDKKVSTPEMIVDFPTSINYTIKLQAETLLKDLDVESSSWHSPVENVVKWRRKIKSRYNEELEHWEPIPMRVESETYAMVIVPADQFVELALGQSNNTLESHVVQMQTHFPSHTIIYLLEGISLWLRKNRTVRNRQFVSAVRDGLGGEQADAPPPSTQSRRRKAAPVYIDEDTIEDALLQLQVLHGALIHHTSLPLETAQWIAVFTQHISTVPYRRQREETNAASAGFCMESGQVRTGDGARDTYLRMLQEVGRVTAPIAYGIASEYDSVAKLVRGLEEHGPLVLEKVRKSANKDGAYSDRTVGQAVSRRLHKIFTGREEGSTDI